MTGRDPGPRPTDAAIVGIGAVFPSAPDGPAFWTNIEKGVDAITDVPPHRWDPDVYFAPDAATGPVRADRFYCRRGGFVDEYATFDPTRFGIMPAAVDGAEPDQLLALRTTAEAIADAGGEDRLPDRSRMGVVFGRGGYMGVATARLDQRVRTAHQLVSVLRQIAPEFDEGRLTAIRDAFQAALGPERPDASIGLVPSFTASRIANRLDLGGPAYTVDAACATGLLAIDHAVAELASGRCDAVIAGSVHHCHIATLWSVFTQLRALSPAMRIRPFDRAADGTLISEGTGAVVLKRLADAQRDGDRVYAVVRGVGVSSDGRAASLMSPLADGQIRALDRAWQAAGLDPQASDALGLLEAHGTGTPVGDAVELDTLARFFGHRAEPDTVIGSVKSMIGHTMQASGMAGLLKAVYAVHHAALPPTLHVEDPHEALSRTRMRLLSESEPWPTTPGTVRRAGVNAFGFGGVNTHVIVEEPPTGRAEALPVPAPGTRMPDERAQTTDGHAVASKPDAISTATAPPAEGVARAAHEGAGELPPGTLSARPRTLHATTAADARMATQAHSGTTARPDESVADQADADRRTTASGTDHVASETTTAATAPAAEGVARAAHEGAGEVPAPGGAQGTASVGPDSLHATTATNAHAATQAHSASTTPPVNGAAQPAGRISAAAASGASANGIAQVAGFVGGIGAGGASREGRSAATARVLDSRVLVLSAGSVAELATLLAKGVTSSASDGPCRLAVVDPNPRRLELAGRVVARGEPWRGRSDIWFTPRPLLGAHARQPGKVAFLFPGLEPETQPPLDDVADAFALPRLVANDAGEIVGRALDALGSGRLLAAALGGLGVRPDVVAGHSLGEWTAMVVAGMYPTSAVDVFLDSLRPGSLAVPDLVYAAVACGAERAAAACAVVGGVVVSHENCPHQCVVCGPADAVRRVLERLRTDGVLGQELPFRSGFHTPMWEPYLDQVRGAFARLPLRDARVPVWSATSVAPYPRRSDEVRDLTIRHLLEPVRFGALVERLHGSGVRAFVQVGAGSLGGFVDDTLRGAEALTVAAHSARHPGLAGLVRVRAALWAEGLVTGPGAEPRESAAPRSAAAASPGGPSARRTGPPVRLDLGSPIVRLDPDRLPAPPPRAVAAPPLNGHQAGNPVLTAFAAILNEAGDAATRTMEAWQRHGPAAPESAAPAVEARPVEPERLSQRREFSLRNLPYVADHCIYEQHDQWADDSDRFPVVPMTTLLDLTGEAARALVPGTIVAGYDEVRALRWLPVAPPTDAEVTATRLDAVRVRVEIAGFTSTVVRLAQAPEAPPEPDRTPLVNEGPAPVRAAALYADRWMFHGPGFAGIDEVTAVADDGIRGVLRTLPAPGALLDAAGQLFGHWMQLRLPTDRLVFPVSVDQVRLYGPPPRTGDRLLATARILHTTATTVRGDVELCDARDGLVRARLLGWTYRRFAADERVWPMKFTPHTTGVGEPQAEGWCLVRTRWPDAASQELVMRRYLGARERAEFATRPPRSRSGWLLGRIAVKDAVRRYLWSRGEGPIYPAEVQVSNDEFGRPEIEHVVPGDEFPRGRPRLHVSLAHKHRLAVAIADRVPVGIDIESLDERSDAFERVALAPAERDLLDRLSDGDPDRRREWLVRFWCAKEAAGKADGIGLAGRPTDRRVVSAAEDLLTVAGPGRAAARPHQAPAPPVRAVRTRVVADVAERYVVAWTVPPSGDGSHPVPPRPVESS
ncbi:type I polyketide synthase [Yinghuangia seranimata]|uniref:type I polyketide synthase n=1 Tax=Yinghuangia seranimata TaxID=408067 RepID=UPI00248CFA66|nr:type I polyketide synthase [Yinghuangia seranimata]MDI2127237.1 beta-ketoacyl synthase N-terminal-like domain-containing protein [Yinghuangia seranimata]